MNSNNVSANMYLDILPSSLSVFNIPYNTYIATNLSYGCYEIIIIMELFKYRWKSKLTYAK